MQGFCNNIYNNDHKIIGWDPNKGKKNVESGTLVTADVSEVDTGVGSMLEGGGGEDGAGYILDYPQPTLGGRDRSYNNIYHNRYSGMDMEKKQ